MRYTKYLLILFLIAGPWILTPLFAQEPLSLETLLEEAMRSSPEIEAARQEWEAMKEGIPQARSLEDPQFSITQWSIPSNFNIGNADETWYGIGQAFPFPGKLQLKGQISAKEADISGQGYLAKVREVASKVKSSYYQLSLIHKAIDLHLEHQALLEEFITIAEQKYAVGQVSQQDILKAQVELSKLHNSLLLLEQEKISIQAEINRLLNRSPEGLLGQPEESSFRPFTMTLEGLEQMALREKPELMAANFTIERSEKAKALAKKNYLPDFMVEIQYWDVHIGPNRWMAMGKINLPWIFRAKYDSRTRQAKAEEDRARADYMALRNQTQFEIKDLFVRIKTSEHLIQVYKDGILPQAEQSLAAARIAYQAGKADFLNLIDSERTLRDFQLEYYTALTQYEQFIAKLEQEVGTELKF
ncbi:MAG: TolC family protein [Nitrospirae bacterium]|nr:TolC family protein [Nitrospirota bacterium]